jgi:hypothetical protein
MQFNLQVIPGHPSINHDINCLLLKLSMVKKPNILEVVKLYLFELSLVNNYNLMNAAF